MRQSTVLFSIIILLAVCPTAHVEANSQAESRSSALAAPVQAETMVADGTPKQDDEIDEGHCEILSIVCARFEEDAAVME